VSLAALGLDAVLVLRLGMHATAQTDAAGVRWIAEMNVPWIAPLGIGIHLGADGISMVLTALTIVLGVLAVLGSWREIGDRVGFFHFNLLWVLAGVLGVFLALDLFLFYVFWELMLVPMYFLISVWGHEDRVRASYKFFLFTQAGGLLMLISIVTLSLLHGRATGVATFDMTLLRGTVLSPTAAFWIMLGFIAAFAVKLPIVPFHTWLPDAHTEAPTAGSVVLAGLLLKTGAYGLLRFVLPLFPEAAARIAPAAMIAAVVGIIYGALMAFGQSDLKRLVAYTSVSHMGFVLLGIFAGTFLSLTGAVLQMAAHGVSTGAFFLLVGMIQERTGTRDLSRMGGFWARAPRLSAFGLLFSLASLGLPGTANFVAEVLVLLGAFRVNGALTIVAASGLVLSAIYSLWIVQRVFHGENAGGTPIADLSARETIILTVLALAVLWFGIDPGLVTGTAGAALRGGLLSRFADLVPHF
jgi:NADH-quinone oxidoreductase subunit M